ncbi:MAG: hypothetical protein AB7N80_03675 [Bdellovibrionales bacterium]
MKTLIKKITLLSVLATVSSSLWAAPSRGGNSAGGGGSNVVDQGSMTAVGIGRFLEKSAGPGPAEQLKRLIEDDKVIVQEVCPKDATWALVSLPESLKSYFQIQVEPKQGRWAKIIGRSKAAIEPLSIKTICESAETYASYASLVMALVDIAGRENHDGSSAALIQSTFEVGGPIKLVVTANRKTIPAVGGQLEESAWYEQETDQVYFGAQDVCKGLSCFGARADGSILTHEVAHSFLRRVLGDAYPKAQHWHDASHLGKMDEDEGYNKLLNSETSPEVAFIEAIANVMEKRHYGQNHPFILRDISLFRLNEQACYQPPQLGIDKVFARAPFAAPVASEVYVGSVLDVFLSGWRANELSEKGQLQSDSGYVVSTLNYARQRQLIAAIMRHRPTDIESLAIAFDRVSGGDLGWRMLREYFFVDYKSSERLGSNFIASRNSSRVRIGMADTEGYYCGTQEDYDKSLSAVLAKENETVVAEAKKLHASRVSSESLSRDMFASVDKARETFLQIRFKVMLPEEVMAELQRLAGRGSFCSSLAMHEQITTKVYRQIEGRGRIVPLSSILNILAQKCTPGAAYFEVNSDGDLQMQMNQMQALLNQIPQMALQKTSAGTELHEQRVQQWMKMKAQLERTMRNIVDITMTAAASKQIVN